MKSVRYAAEYAAFRVAVFLLRMLGVDRASALSGKLWEVFAPYNHRHARVVRHLAFAFPEKSAEERERIARAVWNNLGRTAAEACFIDVFEVEPSRIRLVSPDVLERIKKKHGGKAVITPMHSGNWEVLSPAFHSYGLSCSLIYQRVNNPYADRFLREIRLPYAGGGDVYHKGESAVRRLVSWVRAGNAAIILADQRSRGARPKFFGYPARSTPLPAYIARNFDAPLIACRVIRKDGAHFDLEFKEVDVLRTDDRDRDIADTTQALQSTFEAWIREYPGQWMWAHKRWSREGLPKDYVAPA